MDVMESPAFGGAAVDDDIESPAMAAAVAALRDSSATESAAVAALARLLTAREAALTEKLTAGGSAIAAAPQDAAVRWYFANLVHAPPNWFQATVYFATLPPDDADGAAAAWSLLSLVASMFMVVGQCLAATAVFSGTINKSCGTSDQCPEAGTYCHVGGNSRCLFCGSDAPLPGVSNGSPTQQAWSEGDSLHNSSLVAAMCAAPTDREAYAGNTFPASAVASWCETCVHPIDFTVDQMSFNAVVAENMSAMGVYDWATLLFAATVVALKSVGELQDIQLCEIARRNAGEKVSQGFGAEQKRSVVCVFLILI